MEVPCEEVARRAFITAPQRAVLDALPGVRLAAPDATETPADNAAGLAPPQGGTYMQEQDAPAFGDGPSAPASQPPLQSSPRTMPARNAEPLAQPENPRGATAGAAGVGGATPSRQVLPRPSEQAAREEPSDAQFRAGLPSTQSPDADAEEEAPPPPAKTTAEPTRFTAATLLAAIGSKRRALHTERKA